MRINDESIDLSPSQMKALVEEWFRTYSEKEFEAHNAMMHPDLVVVYPEMCYMSPDASAGKEFLEKTLEEDEKAFLNLSQKVDKISVVGDTAFVEGWFVGDKLGGVLKDSVKGSDIRVRFLHRMVFKDGLVRDICCYYDTALLYQIQLGLEGPSKESPVAPWMLAMATRRAEKLTARQATGQAPE